MRIFKREKHQVRISFIFCVGTESSKFYKHAKNFKITSLKPHIARSEKDVFSVQFTSHVIRVISSSGVDKIRQCVSIFFVKTSLLLLIYVRFFKNLPAFRRIKPTDTTFAKWDDTHLTKIILILKHFLGNFHFLLFIMLVSTFFIG